MVHFMTNSVTETTSALNQVQEAGLWQEFITHITDDMAGQLDLLEDPQDQAVFWSLIVQMAAGEPNTNLNLLEYLLGVTDFADYVHMYLRGPHDPTEE